MRVDRTATLLYARIRGRAGRVPPSGRIPVLMYHSVSSDEEPGIRPYYRLATSPGRFRDQMRLLADEGCTVTSLERALDTMRLGGSVDRLVVVTFDDGFADFLSNAWPVLDEFAFTASMFLPTAFIGDTTRRRFKKRECLTWAEVRDLSRWGISFGSHTVTHPVLHLLPWPQIRSELSESREHIEQVVEAPVTTLAYPYAFPQQDSQFTSRFVRELAALGYCANVTTVIGRLAPGDDRFRIKRIPANDSDDIRLFSAKLAGAFDWVGALQAGWKHLRPQTVRPAALSEE